jgi:hypothetical protein
MAMSAVRTSLLIAALACAATSCARDGGTDKPQIHNPESKGPNMSTPELQIVVDANYVFGMGYGNVWKATVREVKSGALADTEIDLNTFTNEDGARYGGRFKNPGEERGVTLILRRIQRRPAALIGFEAKDGTIWEIVEAR